MTNKKRFGDITVFLIPINNKLSHIGVSDDLGRYQVMTSDPRYARNLYDRTNTRTKAKLLYAELMR